MKYIRMAACFALAAAVAPTVAQGQVVPWTFYTDAASGAECAVVNARDNEFVVLADTDELAFINAAANTLDVLPDTFVDVDGAVFLAAEPVGFVSFFDDGDGAPTVWWTSDQGLVWAVAFDGVTTVLTETDRVPADFVGVPCDPCSLLDDPGLCGACLDDAECDDGDDCTDDVCDPAVGCVFAEVICDDANPCTDDGCVGGACVYVDNNDPCDDGDECTDFDQCEAGACVAVLNPDCDVIVVEPPIVVPRVSLSFCAGGASLAMWLTLAGLVSLGAARRRGGS
ncbi:MAG: hypothetical protein HY763_08295 [Planctomycetes bacterium]|nr:hypothetical protein [Planctomycetota bacterium]